MPLRERGLAYKDEDIGLPSPKYTVGDLDGNVKCRAVKQNDMKSGVVMVVIGDFMVMLLALDLVLYIEGHLYILYVTLSRLIVLYLRCRVN